MKERRISPRTKCSFALTYKPLEETEFQKAFDAFSEKRQRMVLFDQLVHANKKQDFKIKTIEHELAPVLISLNDQLKILIETLSLDFDALQKQEVSDVVINLGGMLFHSDKVIEPGVIVELQLRLEVGAPRILILAEVLSSEISDDAGEISTIVSFTYVEKEDKQVLKKYADMQIKQGAMVM